MPSTEPTITTTTTEVRAYLSLRSPSSFTSSLCTQQRTSNGIIDRRVFQGIVDLNDKDSTDFSTQMVTTYLAVATSTLSDMDKAACVT